MKKAAKIQNNAYAKVQPQMAILGNYLKSLRQELGLSLRKAALLADISAAHLCKIEQGTTFQSIGIEILINLSNTYRIPLDSILQEAGLIEKTGNQLPLLPHYLRSKYNLSPQAIRDMEIAKEVVDKKYID